MKNFILFTCIFIFLLFPFNFAYATRPLYTVDTVITPFTHIVIESGLLLQSQRDNSGFSEVITAARYGLNQNTELILTLPYISRQAEGGNFDGLSNGVFNVKYNFFSGAGGNISAAYLFGIQIKSNDKGNGLNANRSDITNMLIWSHDIGFCKYLLNFGYTFDDEPAGQPQNDFILYNIAMTKPLNDSINFTGEVQYSKNTYTGDIFGETAIGINWRVFPKLVLDAALGCGLNENSSSSNFVFGATYNLDYPGEQ
jgi:hypothetical protein